MYLTRGEQNTAASALAGQRTFIEMLLKSPLETVLKEETVHTLAVRCAAAMGGQHTVLVVDDAHWLSPSSGVHMCAITGSHDPAANDRVSSPNWQVIKHHY